jgi:hypothetical protein
MKMEPIECSKTYAQKIQMLIYHPKERIQHSQHRGSLKSRIIHLYGEETAQDIPKNSGSRNPKLRRIY